MTCPTCHSENNAQAKFCVKCAQPLAAASSVMPPFKPLPDTSAVSAAANSTACVHCATSLRAGAKFCPKCGTSQVGENVIPQVSSSGSSASIEPINESAAPSKSFPADEMIAASTPLITVASEQIAEVADTTQKVELRAPAKEQAFPGSPDVREIVPPQFEAAIQQPAPTDVPSAADIIDAPVPVQAELTSSDAPLAAPVHKENSESSVSSPADNAFAKDADQHAIRGVQEVEAPYSPDITTNSGINPLPALEAPKIVMSGKTKLFAAAATFAVACGVGAFFYLQNHDSLSAGTAAEPVTATAPNSMPDSPTVAPVLGSPNEPVAADSTPAFRDAVKPVPDIIAAELIKKEQAKKKAAAAQEKRLKNEARAADKAARDAAMAQSMRQTSPVRTEASRTSTGLTPVQLCKRDPNFLTREACMFKACVNKWGTGDCPNYQNNSDSNY